MTVPEKRWMEMYAALDKTMVKYIDATSTQRREAFREVRDIFSTDIHDDPYFAVELDK